MTTSETSAAEILSRRRALAASGVVAASAAFLAACGSASPGSSASGGGGGGVTLSTGDVPVGGGTILPDSLVVVTQPVAGTYKAFSATCTHQGCTVAAVQNGSIICPCHGGTFSITDGSVQGGPPPAPLEPKQVSVSGTTITVS